jgi:hypothetical protein
MHRQKEKIKGEMGKKHRKIRKIKKAESTKKEKIKANIRREAKCKTRR